MPQPKTIFIASSSNAKPLARALATYLAGEFRLAKEKADIREWYDNEILKLGRNLLDELVRQTEECGFALILLTRDDFGAKKGKAIDIPRDNTVFELGLFTGELGSDRCFMVCNTDEHALPTVRWAFNKEASAIAEDLRPSCKPPKTAAIFHPTCDCDPDKDIVMEAVRKVFPEDLPDSFYRDLECCCVGA